MTAASSQKKPCKQCQELISSAARLCKHCSSHQDWRGHLSVSSTVLALVVALLSVGTISLPPLVSAFRTPVSQITLSNPVVQAETIHVIATNLGDAPGAILRAEIQSKYFGGQTEIELKSAQDAFIPPGSRQIALNVKLTRNVMDTAILNMQAAPMLIADRQKFGGKLSVVVSETNGTKRPFEFDISWGDISNLLSAHLQRCQTHGEKPSYENGCWGLKDVQAENDRLHNEIQGKLKSIQ